MHCRSQHSDQGLGHLREGWARAGHGAQGWHSNPESGAHGSATTGKDDGSFHATLPNGGNHKDF